MVPLIVVENTEQWPLHVPGARVVTAKEYLTSHAFFDLHGAKVFNLCRTYRYQSVGYYVSLLAAARGHRPLPSVSTLQGMRLPFMIRAASEELESVIARSLRTLKSDRFELSIYFGRNLAKRYDRLSQLLFNLFPAPLLRARFVFADRWRLETIQPIASNEIPSSHESFVIEQAQRFFGIRRMPRRTRPRYDIAILVDSNEADAPSNPRAIAHFVRAAKKTGMAPWVIAKEDFGRLAEFDALFIRATTAVNHYTYRFASRADVEGLVVIDDAESIVRCGNKVYLAELFERRRIPAPRTVVVHRDNAREVGRLLDFPCVLKRPDGSFGAGVVKVDHPQELRRQLSLFFRDSGLVVAQDYVPSTFDWRVGVLDGHPLYVCKYHMAPGHWQVQRAIGERAREYGEVEALDLSEVPAAVVRLAVRAASLIGRGLYGVDLKEIDGKFLVMEVNDNPSIDAGFEDGVLKDALYRTVMQVFYARLEQRGRRCGL